MALPMQFGDKSRKSGSGLTERRVQVWASQPPTNCPTSANSLAVSGGFTGVSIVKLDTKAPLFHDGGLYLISQIIQTNL